MRKRPRNSQAPAGAVVCEICRRERAETKCRLCGRYVCRNDYIPEKDVCSLCASTLCGVCGERLAVASCAACGTLVCDTCGIQATTAVWLCPTCAKKYSRWPPSSLVLSETRRLARLVEETIRGLS